MFSLLRPACGADANLRCCAGCTTAILAIEADPSVKGVVVHGAGRCFCAGADISAFGASGGPAVVDLGRKKSDMLGFEGLNVPVVAAIHGYALGGGLEAALGCHYRVIDEESAVGLPEVNIGLLPGGQGTQRLPRLIGCEAALALMTTGEHESAAQALEWGVVDEIAPAGSDMLAAAKALAISKIGQVGTQAIPPQLDFRVRSLTDCLCFAASPEDRGHAAAGVGRRLRRLAGEDEQGPPG